jgi:hypothetical protein
MYKMWSTEKLNAFCLSRATNGNGNSGTQPRKALQEEQGFAQNEPPAVTRICKYTEKEVGL